MKFSKNFVVCLLLIIVFLFSSSLVFGKSTYLGPLGSFTSEAAIEYFGEHFPKEELVPMKYDEMFAAYRKNEVTNLCVAAMTSVVGTVDMYVDEILKLDQVTIIGEYPKFIVYSLLAKPGAKIEGIKTVVTHPVALEEAKPWVDKVMPNVVRTTAASTGAAAKQVSDGTSLEIASLGPKIGAKIYGLEVLATDIEKGPHNVTRFLILGREMPKPTGNDKTTLVVEAVDKEFNEVLSWFAKHKIKILDLYERPNKKSLDGHYYIFDVEGHSKKDPLKSFLTKFPKVKLLGSYPRKY